MKDLHKVSTGVKTGTGEQICTSSCVNLSARYLEVEQHITYQLRFVPFLPCREIAKMRWDFDAPLKLPRIYKSMK